MIEFLHSGRLGHILLDEKRVSTLYEIYYRCLHQLVIGGDTGENISAVCELLCLVGLADAASLLLRALVVFIAWGDFVKFPMTGDQFLGNIINDCLHAYITSH